MSCFCHAHEGQAECSSSLDVLIEYAELVFPIMCCSYRVGSNPLLCISTICWTVDLHTVCDASKYGL